MANAVYQQVVNEKYLENAKKQLRRASAKTASSEDGAKRRTKKTSE